VASGYPRWPVNDGGCITFLQWALPLVGYRWSGFRRVYRQVCRRIAHRRRDLGLHDLAAYRRYLGDHPEEWRELDRLCRVTISRFGRDRGMWSRLTSEILPRLAAESGGTVAAWSAGCGAGEEPYTLAVAWQLVLAPRWPRLTLEVLATDIDDGQLARAVEAGYPPGALKELPDAWRDVAFETRAGLAYLQPQFCAAVRVAHHDVREAPPGRRFDLILCRNLAFTYFDEATQRAVATSFRSVLRQGGVLVVGAHERVPEVPGLEPCGPALYAAQA